jgi:hypothetical protein
MTDTPSTSGEGVDVLSTIMHVESVCDDAEAGALGDARLRIAELIDAAEPFADMDGNYPHGEYISVRLKLTDIRRIGAAYRACRVTPGAHR